MTRFALLAPLALLACDADPAAMAVDQAAGPGTYDAFVVSEIFGGNDVTMTWSGLNPGTLVRFVASSTGEGLGPCPAVLRGDCVNILAPVRLVGSAVADASGNAQLVFTPPPGLSGAYWWQAVGYDPSTRTIEKSNTYLRGVGPGICPFIFLPVCSTLGNDFDNDCLAEANGEPVAFEGFCP